MMWLRRSKELFEAARLRAASHSGGHATTYLGTICRRRRLEKWPESFPAEASDLSAESVPGPGKALAEGSIAGDQTALHPEPKLGHT
jgi:hypothetical protein